MDTQVINTKVFEIKYANQRRWTRVRATSIANLSKWADANNVADWRTVGMMSNTEIIISQSLKVVA